MLGAITGDIVGSRFEWRNIKSKDFDLFTTRNFVTDDSVMTVAIADALLKCGGDYERLAEQAVTSMREIGQPYPHCGYGGGFRVWMYTDEPHPYNSYGNGAAMRVSAVGFVAKSLEEARDLSYKVTAVTHSHREGIKGAEATACAVWMARNGKSIAEIRDYVHTHYYPMDFTLDGIRESYRFDGSCQGTVPQAIMAFLESTGFEDAIRNAISIGGDSDTLAAITGGIAQAYYGIPDNIRDHTLSFLDDRLMNVVTDFYMKYGAGAERT